MQRYQIIDNFLPKEYYNELSSFIKSNLNIPWFYVGQDTKNSKNKNGYFTFSFYDHFKPDHQAFLLLEKLIKKLECKSLIEFRANLTFRDIDCVESSYHTDFAYDGSKTAILYFTTCNAKTVLKINENEIFCKSEENRLLIFDSNVYHKVIYHNDVHKRYILNMNYF